MAIGKPQSLGEWASYIATTSILTLIAIPIWIDGKIVQPFKEAKHFDDPKQYYIGQSNAERLIQNHSLFPVYATMVDIMGTEELSMYQRGFLQYCRMNYTDIEEHNDQNYDICRLIDKSFFKHG